VSAYPCFAAKSIFLLFQSSKLLAVVYRRSVGREAASQPEPEVASQPEPEVASEGQLFHFPTFSFYKKLPPYMYPARLPDGIFSDQKSQNG
jgi:hypothetical protein